MARDITSCKLTAKEAFDLEVADAEAQHRQLVQPRSHLLAEGQQAGQLVQFAVEPVAVPLRRVGLGAIRRRRFGAAEGGVAIDKLIN